VRISIGIPFYNAKGTLEHAIRSVFAQSFNDWELILVDDGSTDGSLEIAKSIKDERVRVYSDGQNRRLPYRLNQIAELAKGDYIARMDADDLMHPKRIEKQYKYLQENESVDVVGTGEYVIDDDLIIRGKRGVTDRSLTERGVLARGAFCHPTIMGRTEWFRAFPYDEAYIRAEDHELWCRSFAISRFHNIREPLHYKREYGVFSLSNYTASCRTDRKIFRRYGPETVGKLGTLRLLVLSSAKQFIFSCASLFGLTELLIARRDCKLTVAELDRAEKGLRIVLNTTLDKR